jgi:hypothetical protein
LSKRRGIGFARRLKSTVQIWRRLAPELIEVRMMVYHLVAFIVNVRLL